MTAYKLINAPPQFLYFTLGLILGGFAVVLVNAGAADIPYNRCVARASYEANFELLEKCEQLRGLDK